MIPYDLLYMWYVNRVNQSVWDSTSSEKMTKATTLEVQVSQVSSFFTSLGVFQILFFYSEKYSRLNDWEDWKLRVSVMLKGVRDLGFFYDIVARVCSSELLSFYCETVSFFFNHPENDTYGNGMEKCLCYRNCLLPLWVCFLKKLIVLCTFWCIFPVFSILPMCSFLL